MPRYIEADALNAAIEEWFEGVCVYDDSPSEAVNDFQSIVDEQPTVSPDEVRGVGEWIDYQQGRWVYAKCSECGTVHDVRSTYCPSCGARMKGAEDG